MQGFYRRIYVLLAGFFILVEISVGQTVTIESITITGLKHTRPSIVYRELTFKEGDTLIQNDLGPILERNRNNLFNLGIFNEAIVNVSEWDTKLNQIDITIDVKESWYIYALPIIELADRNFNVWWTTYNHSLDRLNLGGRLEWLNFTGRNDKLKAKLQVGYTPKQEIEYRFPYLNKAQSLGVTTGFQHSVNKEVSYLTTGNQEQFVQIDERKLQRRWEGQVSTSYRPSIFVKYELSFNYKHTIMDKEVIADYNPQLFRNGDNTHDMLTVRFAFEYDDRDLKIFPSKGLKSLLEFEKLGIGENDDENSLRSTLFLEWNTTTGKKFQHRISTVGQYSLSRSRPSFMYYKGLGTEKKYVAGYELFIVNGLDFIVGKYQLAYKVLDKQVRIGRMMPMEQFRRMPLNIYFSILAEAGYVNDPFTGDLNSFANRWLYGGGPAASIMVYNNFLFQFSYCTNHLGEWGLFIHNRTSF
jgi:outer membrane protein assembly factor BamA